MPVVDFKVSCPQFSKLGLCSAKTVHINRVLTRKICWLAPKFSLKIHPQCGNYSNGLVGDKYIFSTQGVDNVLPDQYRYSQIHKRIIPNLFTGNPQPKWQMSPTHPQPCPQQNRWDVELRCAGGSHTRSFSRVEALEITSRHSQGEGEWLSTRLESLNFFVGTLG